MITTIVLFLVFIIYTVLVKLVDVQAIGPEGSEVGFATLNGWFHSFTGENMGFYEVTDLISIVPFLVVGAFGVIGLVQLIKRKKLMKVDKEILALGVFYILVLVAFCLFEVVKINYRPVLIEGELETSYPSSTTMLAITVFATALMVVPKYLKGWKLHGVEAVFGLMLGFMVAARIFSGVHWLTDIIGGVLLSAALISVFVWVRKKLALCK